MQLDPARVEADRRTRTVRNLVEPIAGVAFFAVEVHDRYEALGFPNPGGTRDGVRSFDWPAYFVARAACLGPVRGEVAAAAFGVFPVARVASAVDEGFRRASPAMLLRARLDGTVLALERLLADRPEFDPAGLEQSIELLDRGLAAADPVARPLFAGLRSLPEPETALGRWWRLCDQYREHRMDVHVSVLAAAGLDGCQACLLNDARQGLALGSYVVTRGWSAGEISAAVETLADRGLVDGRGLTPGGRDFREDLEAMTDRGQRSIVEAIGDDLARFERVAGWQRQVVIDGFGYPGRRFVENTASRAGTAAPVQKR